METKRNRPQLTISLLASDRPDTIRKCLDSLDAIRKAIPSELILVDTSKSPQIHEILLEYTDQVYTFEWCRDFSKARNVGLKKAKGEWFLFLDDDEWFVETDELIAFFQSGEYKDYGYANYQVRNFYDPTYTYYSDSWVSRMIRIEEDTEFRSKVHEYLYPVRGNGKNIYSMVYHSGYIYATEEEKRAHFERNCSLLLEMTREEPQNLRWQMQLVQEYRSVKEWATLCSYCEERLRETSKIDNKYDNVHIGTLYAGYSEALVFQKDYDKAYTVCKKALEDKRNTELCKALMHLLLAEVCLKQENYSESVRHAERYLKEEQDLGRDEERIAFQKMALLVNEAFDDTNIKKAYSILISCGLRQKTTEAFHKYYNKLQWDETVIYVFDGTEKYMVEAMATMSYDPLFVRMTAEAFQNKEFRRLMCEVADAWSEQDREGFYRIMRIYAQTGLDDWYIHYAKACIAQEEKNSDVFRDEVHRIYQMIYDVFEVPELLYEMMEQERIQVFDLWQEVSVDLWRMSLDDIFESGNDNKKALAQKHMQQILENTDWRMQYFEMCESLLREDRENVMEFYKKYYQEHCFVQHRECLPEKIGLFLGAEPSEWMQKMDAICEQGIFALESVKEKYESLKTMEGAYFRKCYAGEVIRLTAENESYSALDQRFFTFMKDTLEYYLMVFRDEAFEGDMEMLPPEARAAVYLNLMYSLSRNETEQRISCLRECAKVYPALGNNIKKYANMIGEQKKESANAELLQMVEAMKEKILLMAEQGMKEQALSVLEQVRSLVPDHRELIRMEEDIKGVKREIVLSISILASNREETVKKTIQSLEKLRSKVACELIIVDTGCSDALHNYLAKYADVMTRFTWCNDFAKARNAGLALARGDWFLYMDDDEWFVQDEELIDFFVSGRYKTYDSADYIVRNYLDMKGSQYTDSWVARMVRLKDGMKFQSRIHEYILPDGNRNAYIHAIADHYGYVYETEEKLQEHFRRNEKLLREMLEEEPENIRWYMLLAQEYRTVRDWERLYQMGETGLSVLREAAGERNNMARGTFYAAKIIAEKERQNHENVLCQCKDALKDVRNSELFQAFCNLWMCWSAYWLCQYEDAKQYGENYLKWLLFFEEKEDLLAYQSSVPFVADCFDEVMKKQVYSILICSDLRSGGRESLDVYLEKLGWNEGHVYLFEDMIPTLVEVIDQEGEEKFGKVIKLMEQNTALWNYFCKSRR